MDKGKGIAKDHVPNDGINYEDDDYDDLFDDGLNPDIPLYVMGSDFEEDEEDVESVAADAMAHVEGAADAFESADMDASESSNVTTGTNMDTRQNKKLKTRKGRIVVQYNALGVPAGDEATELASYIGVLARTLVSILFPDWPKFLVQTMERL